MQHTLANPARISGRLTALTAAARHLRARWTDWRLTRRRHAELQGLDAQTLRDIGLHRSELLSVAGGDDFTRLRRVGA